MKIIRKIKEVGLKNVIVGTVKRIKYEKLIKKYHINPWHLSPYEWRKYVQECAKYINCHNCKTVVDIGCGLGGLLQHIDADNKIGLDIQEEVIHAARELSDGTITLATGSFEELTEKPVDYLITLNFMHGCPEATWTKPYRLVAERNDVRNFIVDTLPPTKGRYLLDWGKILPENYRRIERLGPFLSGRYIEIWEKYRTSIC